MPLVIRPHLASDAAASLEVFYASIRITAAADYSPKQIEAWASPEIDVSGWTTKRMARTTMVAVIDDTVVGFIDVDAQGYIDMLFVHPNQARRGVGAALLAWAVARAAQLGATSLDTHASLTARPFFESHGFIVVGERQPIIRGVALQNFVMSRPI